MGRRGWMWTGVILAAGGAGFVLVPRRTPPAPVQVTAETDRGAAPKVTMENLAELLGADDAAARSAAEEFLTGVPYQRREALSAMRGGTDNAAAKAALSGRLAEIYRMLSTAPPPISLHVHGASLAEVVEALNVEMGTEMYCDKSGPGDYTLDADKQPYWEVIVSLEKQRTFAINVHRNTTFLDNPGPFGQYAISGPFCCHVNDVPFTRSTPPSLFLGCQMQPDPRMTISQVAYQLRLSGPGVQQTGGGAPPATSGGLVGMPSTWSKADGDGSGVASLNHRWLSAPGQKPTRIVNTVQAEAQFTVQVPGPALEVSGLETRGNWQGKLGDAVVGVSDFRADNGRASFTFKVTPPEAAKRLAMRVRDGTGEVQWNQKLAVDAAGELWAGLSGAAPYKLQVSLAESERMVTVDFPPLQVREPEKP